MLPCVYNTNFIEKKNEKKNGCRGLTTHSLILVWSLFEYLQVKEFGWCLLAHLEVK